MVKVIFQIYPVIYAENEAERDALRPLGLTRERPRHAVAGPLALATACDRRGGDGYPGADREGACSVQEKHGSALEVREVPGQHKGSKAPGRSRWRLARSCRYTGVSPGHWPPADRRLRPRSRRRGGRSSGPRTWEGRRRSRQALRAGRARWVKKMSEQGSEVLRFDLNSLKNSP